MPKRTRRRRKRSRWGSQRLRRRICYVLDVLVLLGAVAIVVGMFMRAPSKNYDVDRKEYPVKGIDLSAHNGEVDFLRVAADSVHFVLLKVTEGTDFTDSKFSKNYLGAVEAGLKVGAYHFFRFDTPGDKQARHLMRTLRGKRLDMPIVIDVEEWGNTNKYDAAKVKKNLHALVREVRRAGYPLMMYTNKKGYNTFIAGEFDDLPLWICSLSKPPSLNYWTLWQHSHKHKVKGVKGAVDANTYNGNRRQFEAWLSPFTVRQ